MIGCTTATATHLAGAEVVATSWRRLHPEGTFYVLLADADRRTHGEPAPFVLFPEDLGLDAAELRVRRGIYSAFEYTTSLKPHLLRFLLRYGAEAVIFTDSDTDVYGPLDQLGALARSHAVCLTPHALSPLPRDGMSTHELEQLTSVFSTPASSPSARPPAPSSTGGRRAFDATASTRRLTASSSSSGGRTSPRATSTMSWSATPRSTSLSGTCTSGASPPPRAVSPSTASRCGHFHFSGFDPAEPRQLCKHTMSRPVRVRMSDQLSLAALYGDYAERVMAAGHRERTSGGYPFASSATGRRLGRWERVVYREAVLAAEAGAAHPPPDPFDPAEAPAFDRLVDMVDGYQRHLSAPALARLARARGAMDAPRPRAARERIMARARRLVMSRPGVRDGFLSPSEVVAAEYSDERRPTR